MTLAKTQWDFDTLVVPLSFLMPKKCLEDGEYRIVVPSFSIVDMAGNAFAGNAGDAWNVKVVNGCHHHRGHFPWGGILWLVLSCGIGFGMYFVYRRKRQFGVNRYFDSIGDASLRAVASVRSVFANEQPILVSEPLRSDDQYTNLDDEESHVHGEETEMYEPPGAALREI